MIMNKKFRITLAIISLCTLISILSCEKEDDISTENPLNDRTTAIFNPELEYEILTDIDGNTYKTITIGNQTWMAENLRTTKYRDGSLIPEITSIETWINLSSGAYSNYNNTKSLDTISTYGRLYNWYAVTDSRNLAPEGWHIPSYEELYQLAYYLDYDSSANKLKETGLVHWNDYNDMATNESGFTALPGGWRSEDGVFRYNGTKGLWWSTKEKVNSNEALAATIERGLNFMFGTFGEQNYGCSVRCIKD